MTPQLTKDDTRALWYAVDAYGAMVKAMRDLPTPVPADVAAKEREVLATAKRALRKVNAIRQAQVEVAKFRNFANCRPAEKLQAQRKTAGGAGA